MGMPLSSNNISRISPAEYLLAGGLICTVMAPSLIMPPARIASDLYLIRIIGLMFFLLAPILLIAAGIVARAGNLSPWRKIVGLILFLIGLVLFLIGVIQSFIIAAYILEMVSKFGMNMFTPKHLHFTDAVGAGIVCIEEGCLSVITAVLMALGLWLRTGWPARRCAWWGMAILLAPITAAAVFWIL